MATQIRSLVPGRPLARKEPLRRPTVSTPRFCLPSSPTPTLLVVTNEHHFPQRRPKLGQDRQVISDLDLTRFVDDDSLDRDDLRESTVHEPIRRQHAHRAKDDSSSQ